MSQGALLQGVLNLLRKRCPDVVSESNSDIRIDGAPPGVFGGKYYVAIQKGSHSGGHAEYMHEVCGFRVVVSLNLGVFPGDAFGQHAYASRFEGRLDKIVSEIKSCLAQRKWEIITEANLVIHDEQPDADGFFVAPFYAGESEPSFQDGSWAGREPDQTAYLVQTMQYEGAERAQSNSVAV